MNEMSIGDLQAQMEAGRTTARRITQGYLDRIAALDHSGPTLRSVIELNPDALAIAAALDEERQSGAVRGPLHGVPVLLKDNIETADRMATSAGSLALESVTASKDAFVARRLREAGAVILGKTNLSEWANFRSTRSTSGWSSRGGQTRNPYALDRNPCGSSSGSAVAVAANLCAVSVGTETNGSIICPSSVNGIVGIKPTVGLVSRAGIIPIAHSQDTAGPMARTVTDAAILLGALVGVDPRDRATEASEGRLHADYTPFLDADGLKGARIGVARNFFGFHAAVDHVMEAAIEMMRRLGAEIVDPANIETAEQLKEPQGVLLQHEFKAGLNRYLSGLAPTAPVHSLAELIAFNERHREQVMPYFGQELLLLSEEQGPLQSDTYLEAQVTLQRLARTEGIDAMLARHRLDAIVAPSGGPAWLTDLITGDHYGGGSSSPAAIGGYPNITVPAGAVFGLPIGISFFGGAYQEPTLIRLAYAFERGTAARQPPRFLPTADLTVG